MWEEQENGCQQLERKREREEIKKLGVFFA